MKNIVYIAASLDGFIADKEGGLDWLMSVPNPEGSDFGFAAFMDSVDALVMGRRTFEKVLSFGEWPYVKKVFVLSNTLKTIPAHLSEKAETVQGELTDILESLHKREYQNLYIDGGKTIQSFLAHDLIDEMIISTIPTLLGYGVPLFGLLKTPLSFKLTSTEKLNDYIAQSRYVRDRG